MNGIILKCSMNLSKLPIKEILALEILRSNNKLKWAIEEAGKDYKSSPKPMNYIPRRIHKYYEGYLADNILWCILNNKYLPICPKCHSIFEFKSFNPRHKGFKHECSCGYKYPSPTKGKTYLEIYGTQTPNVGYQIGDNNLAKRPNIRQKISIGVAASYTPKLREIRRQQAINNLKIKSRFHKRYEADDGNFYRSSLEVNFVNWILTTQYNNRYEYEVVVHMKNGHIKIVDFVIDGDIYIEISGYAFEDWRLKFDTAIGSLRDTLPCNRIILLLTYPKYVDLMRTRMSEAVTNHINFFIEDVKDIDKIIKKFKFFNILNHNERTNHGI